MGNSNSEKPKELEMNRSSTRRRIAHTRAYPAWTRALPHVGHGLSEMQTLAHRHRKSVAVAERTVVAKLTTTETVALTVVALMALLPVRGVSALLPLPLLPQSTAMAAVRHSAMLEVNPGTGAATLERTRVV